MAEPTVAEPAEATEPVDESPAESTEPTGPPPSVSVDPEKWLEATAQSPDLLCIIIFRGSWCKYDKTYLRNLGKYYKSGAVENENISLIAWTSEGEAGARKADEEWGLTKECGFKEVLGDDTCALANYLIDDMILSELKIMTPEEAGLKDVVPQGSYPNGLAMPGIVWYGHHGSAPIFEWCHPCDIPGNRGGPYRPDPADMWKEVLKRKHALDHGNAVMPSHGTDIKMCTSDFDVFLSGCQVL